MDIMVGDIYSIIPDIVGNSAALATIRQICRARPNGYRYMPKFRAGFWDGYISLMQSINVFPSGLLGIILPELDRLGCEYRLVTNRMPPYQTVTPDFLQGVTLRDYQVEAANELLKCQHGVAKMATNSGKTEVMAAIIKALYIPNTLVLLHRKELLYQTAERFSQRLGIECGLIGDGSWEPKMVTIAMIQTLSDRIHRPDVDMDWLQRNVLLMVDECHHASSAQMMDVLSEVPGCYRFGFSGTPLKHDMLSDLKLAAFTGTVVYDVDNAYLVNTGYSARPIIKLITLEQDSYEDYTELSYQEAYTKFIVNNDIRNDWIAEMAKQSSGVVLILVNRLDHGKAIAQRLPGSVFVTGRDTTEYRQKIIQSMREGSGIFIATPIFDEGVDIPSIDTIILAAGGNGYVKLLQRIGRGMRKKGSDNVLRVVDFIDDTNEYLLQHSAERIDTYVTEQFETELV